MSTLSIKIKLNDTAGAMADQFKKAASMPHTEAKALENLFKAINSGNKDANIKVSYSASSPVQASATATCASVAVDDTITIGKTTLTAKASPANEDQFSQAGTDTADGASLAAAINAHSVLSKLVYATAATGVVTITAHSYGSVGNHIVLTSSNGTRLAVTGSGYLASGAGGEEVAPVAYGLGL